MALPVYLFALTFYISLFAFVAVTIQRSIYPTIDPGDMNLSKLIAVILVGHVG